MDALGGRDDDAIMIMYRHMDNDDRAIATTSARKAQSGPGL